ncbi:MAG: V-type ATP synthase subunit D [Acholeplasmatales bacterium]|jgi:V/A-type H+-transporting ATPase subunit D|nr:V-type ATP synthase subunit D [Acholeplasmataceae bacterium]MDY0114905.1 V-type ATP synthase subunit D [Acholeplasmatales bacterium]MCK9234475.1 V-type ATP synthase subunit D [Acholeplasmataceae bacterium]MCK9289530.1 V-type ATP synthase subunit D [Acholeplasmataceae bacterium]MCK9427154.1 V-type ATP synthase subunit D [Acholeplasmataceae bacterium]
MQKQVNPTRMELTKLKNQLTITRRGHKLLKDKQDEMIRVFMLIIEEAKNLRIMVDKNLSVSIKAYKKALANSDDYTINEALFVPSNEVKLKFAKKNVMSVYVPEITIEETKERKITYGLANTPALLDEAVISLEKLLPAIIKLAEIQKQIDMLALEIEKTRRRVNAIEHLMIPELEVLIKTIQMKLEDSERANTVRMMKSKEIITKRGK